MKKQLLPIFILALTCLVLIFANWPWRWILIHGDTASKQANHMLSGDVNPTPDEFIDYTIYTTKGCGVFTSHDNPERTIVYCSKGLPVDTSEIGGSLKHIFGAWYFAEVQGG
ncbi:MAG: hypothetical protein HY937_03685 [Nitrosomonadales bacterium]|nr:hypothetical protein [Nitrosomonadales bacterium]